MDSLLAKYNQAKTVNFRLFEVDGVNLRIDATFSAGDVKIMKDEGVEANTTNLPTDEGQGYSLVLTATEMSASRIQIYIVDSATKVWLDMGIYIETYGNVSAAHAFDLDTASSAQTGDSFARLGAPVAASVSADVATVNNDLSNGTDGLSALKALIDALNDIAITDIVSAGAITTLSGAVVNVDTVDVNTDMRGTDSAALASALATAQADLDTITGIDGVTLAAAQALYAPALASVATEVRLAELDAANLPADIDGLTASVASIAASPGVGATPFIPSTIAVVAGTNAAGTADDLANDDLDRYTLDDSAGTLTLDFDYQLAAEVSVIQYVITVAAQGNNDSLTLQFFDQDGLVFDNIDTVAGSNTLAFTTFDKVVLSKYTSSTGLFQVRLTGTGLTSATVTVNKAVSYGVASATGIPNGASITLATNSVNTNYIGRHWVAALNSADITGAFIFGAVVTGTATATNTYEFEECEFGNVTLDNAAHIELCEMDGGTTFTIAQVGDFVFHGCFTEGLTPWIIDFGALGATKVHLYAFDGNVNFTNMAAGDEVHITGAGSIMTTTCTGGIIEHDGFFQYEDLGGNITELQSDIKVAVDAVLVDTGTTIPTTLGTPVADVATDIAAVKAETALIVADTGTDGVLLAADQPVDMVKINGSAEAASNLEASATALIATTVATAASATSFTLTAGSTSDDVHIGRNVAFRTGSSLAGEISAITDYVGATKTVTCDALTSTPGVGDEIVIL